MNKQWIIRDLEEEKKALMTVRSLAEKRLKKAPDGSVRTFRHGNSFQYYFRKDSKTASGVYMPASDFPKARQLAQKKYDQKIMTAAGKQLSVIERFLKGYDPDALKKVYSTLSPGITNCVLPAEIPDDEYVEQWLACEYQHKEFREGTPIHYTGRQERVRSKSEVMIADALWQAGIPYRYECPLELKEQTNHPDFTILRIGDRKEIYWEHLGMMDDPGYLEGAIERIRIYENNGIFPGESLILTMETSRNPMNLAVIHRMIEQYCI